VKPQTQQPNRLPTNHHKRRVAHSSRSTSRDEWGTPTFNPQAVAVASLSVILEGNLLYQPNPNPTPDPNPKGTASEPVPSEAERMPKKNRVADAISLPKNRSPAKHLA